MNESQEPSIVSINREYNIKEMTKEIREVIEKYTQVMKDDIHISVIYYEIHKYKKIKTKKKEKGE